MDKNFKSALTGRSAKVIGIGAAAFILLGTGAAIGSGTPTVVEKTIEVPKEVIKEVPGQVQIKNVEVFKTPASCLHALDNSEALAGHFGTAMDLAAEAIDQAASWDGAGLTATTDKMTKLNEKVTKEVNTYVVNASDCRANQ